MKKLKLFAFALATLFSASVLAYDAPAEGSYDLTSESTAKVSSSGRFIVISNGLYAYRLGSGYSYSNGNGLKTQSNQGGFVFRLNENTKLTCSIKHAESRNAHTVTINVYSISEEQYAEFDNNKAAATKNQTLSLSGLTPSTFTIDIPAETNTFTGTQELAAGYYAVVPTGEKGNTYMSAIAFEPAAAIVDPVAEVTIAGPARGTASYAAEFTASTDIKADAYQWFVNDAAQEGATAKTFEFTPADAGDYSIVCKARNANNATGEWIASEPIAFKALSSLWGELIKAVHTGKTTATVTGLIGGTADKSTESSGKINSDGYFGIQLASGNFQEGDTLVVNIGAENSSAAVLIIYAESTAENVILNTGVAGVSGDNKFVLPAAVNGKNALYIVRTADNAWNAVVNSISVVRPMAVKSSSEAFKSVSFNGEALVANFDANHAMTVEGSYVDAPVVVFTKTVTTIYEDNSQVVKDVEVNVTAEEVAGAWQAQATINSVTYTINAAKAASFTVHYMDGETELGTENVAANGTVEDYAQYQQKNLATFVGWYQDVDLTIEAILTAPITAETYLYAKFENKYAESINIEKAVMENSKGYDIIAQLGTLGYASNITGSLDSLSVKDDGMRNYAYLGLKVKQNGALLNFRLAAGNTVTIKFGEIKKTPNVSINGGNYADMVITDKVYTHTAEADELISIKMMDNNAVVFQQIMIGEELQAPELFAINCAEVENGTVAAPFKMGIPGEEVELTFTPAEGYIVMSCTVNGTEIHQSAPGAAITFEMPAEDVTIQTTFSLPTALDNAEAAVKAEKVIRDGQVLILRDGKIFNALGAEVK